MLFIEGNTKTRRKRQFCKAGHALTEANSIYRSDRGTRECLECKRRRNRKYASSHKAEKQSYDREYTKKKREADREAWRAKNRIYDRNRRQHNPGLSTPYGRKRRAQARRVLATLTNSQWEAIKKAYRNHCAYCGKHSLRLTQDHVIPISKGGGHTAENVVPACRSCNSSKGNRQPSVIPPVRLLV